MKRVFLIIICASVCFNVFGSIQTDSIIRRNYKEDLSCILQQIAKGVSPVKIQYIIPETADEASIYFSSDYDDNTSKLFGRLQQRVLNLCIQKDRKILTKYLKLSQFVDGYFAEDYFDNVEKIAMHSKSFFCTTLRSIDIKSVRRLNPIKKKYCK